VSTNDYGPPQCGYCGAYHVGICPRIEEIERYPDGTAKRIKFRPQGNDAQTIEFNFSKEFHSAPYYG
jgi:hypothetical protein